MERKISNLRSERGPKEARLKALELVHGGNCPMTRGVLVSIIFFLVPSSLGRVVEERFGEEAWSEVVYRKKVF